MMMIVNMNHGCMYVYAVLILDGFAGSEVQYLEFQLLLLVAGHDFFLPRNLFSTGAWSYRDAVECC